MNVTCPECGWVHFAVTREHAEAQVATFARFYETLTEKQKQDYYKGRCASISDYECCNRCGESYRNFRPWQSGDADGVFTMGPIIQVDSSATDTR